MTLPGPLIVDFAPRRMSSVKHKVKKTVNFSSVQSVGFGALTHESDVSKLFYSKEDVYNMKRARRRAVKKVRQRHEMIASGQCFNDEVFNSCSWVGIENLLTPGIIKKTVTSRDQCVHAVLEEQMRQAAYGECDPFRLAHVSHLSSKWAVNRAKKIGFYQSR